MNLNPEKMAQEELRAKAAGSSPLGDLMSDAQYHRIWHEIHEFSMAADPATAAISSDAVDAAIRDAMTSGYRSVAQRPKRSRGLLVMVLAVFGGLALFALVVFVGFGRLLLEVLYG